MELKIRNIKWDAGGMNKRDLPKSATLKTLYGLIDLEEIVGYWLCSTYGFDTDGFEYEIIGDRQKKLLGDKNREIGSLRDELANYNAIANFLWEHKGCFADEQQKEIDRLFDAL